MIKTHDNLYLSLMEYYQIESAKAESLAGDKFKDSNLPIDEPLKGDSTKGQEASMKVITEESIKGLPQGSSISPLLSSFVLGRITEMVIQSLPGYDINFILYADDGMIHSNLPSHQLEKLITTFIIPKFENWGIKFNIDKSGWVKRDSEWIKPLKFLGLTYDGNGITETGTRGLLKASTRKGSTLVFDKGLIFQDYAHHLSRYDQEKDLTVFYSESDSLHEMRLKNQVWQKISKTISKVQTKLIEIRKKRVIPVNEIMEEVIKQMNKIPQFELIKNDTYFGEQYLIKMIKLYANIANPAELQRKPVSTQYHWKDIIESQSFGYILSKLYIGEWYTKVEQDFHLYYKPQSWCYYALQDIYNPLLNICRFVGMHKYIESIDFQKFDKVQQHEIPGFLDEEGKFNKVNWNQFNQYRKVDLRTATSSEKRLQQSLRIKVIQQWNKPTVRHSTDSKISLSVFNSSSYAIPSLIHLFHFRNKTKGFLHHIKSTYSLNPKQLRKIRNSLHLGISPIIMETILQKLNIDPGLYNLFLHEPPTLHEGIGLSEHIEGKGIVHSLTAKSLSQSFQDSFNILDWFDESKPLPGGIWGK